MPTTLPQKLRIADDMKLLSLHAPDNFETRLIPKPQNLLIADKLNDYNQIHWFVKSKAEMEKELDKVLKLLKDDVICWIYYPKSTSKIQTDLSRDKGWETLMERKDLQWISLISFDDTWSAFAMRLKTAKDEKKETAKKPREIFDYIDATKKTVRLPDDLATALKKSKKATAHFDTISFSNKKEYVEWVITAKQEATRKDRVKGTIERLEKGWKNPRNL